VVVGRLAARVGSPGPVKSEVPVSTATRQPEAEEGVYPGTPQKPSDSPPSSMSLTCVCGGCGASSLWHAPTVAPQSLS
jgi:hypothetical protein